MGRNWQPKYKVRCSKCGWRGKRTAFTAHNHCPKCGAYAVALLLHFNANTHGHRGLGLRKDRSLRQAIDQAAGKVEATD